jgi:outer membrane protein
MNDLQENDMMNASTFFTFLLCIFIFTQAVYGQSQFHLTLESSVNLALQQNPDFKIAEKELAKAKADVLGSYSGILPQLDLYANYQHNWKIQETTIPNFIKTMLGPAADPTMPDYVKISFGLENSLVYGATVVQPLFLGGAGLAGIYAAKAGKKSMEQNVEATRQQLIYRTTNVFYTCLLAQELIDVQEEALAQAEANLIVVRKKYEVGIASGFDKMRAEVEVANLQPEVITARNNYQVALTQLKALLGLNRDAEIEISGEFNFVEDEYQDYTLTDLQNTASQNRPELWSLAEQRKITRNGVVIARSNFFPKLFFTTDYSYLGMRQDLSFRQRDFSVGFYSGLRLQIPIFHGFQSTQQYQKAKLDDKILSDSEKQARDGVAAEVEVAYHKFREAVEKYFSARETIELAQEALRLANLMYEEGTNTQLDVLVSQLALTQARMNFVSSLYQYEISRYRLRKVTGTLEGII